MSHVRKRGEVIVDRYVLDRELGEGGFGTVWLAQSIRDGDWVAIKILKHVAESSLIRFRREAQMLARLDHPGCVRFREFGEEPSGPFLVTDYVPGETLRGWLSTPRTLDEKLEIGAQICDAIAYTHREGVVHRDLKPSNIMVARRGPTWHVTVLDFGVAKLFADRLTDVTKTGEVLGTPGYMSPEQLRGRNPGPPTDLYALGVLLFELIEERPVFSGQSALEVAMAHLTEPAPSLTSGAPVRIRRLVDSLLSKDPHARPTAGAARVALRPGEPAPRPSARHKAPPRFRVAAIGAVVLAGAVLAAVGWWGVDSSEPALMQARVETTRVNPLAPEVEQSDRAMPKLGVELDAGTLPSGCGRSSPTGTQKLTHFDGLDRSTILVHVPTEYDADTPHPVLLLLHPDFTRPETFLENTGFAELADRDGVVIVAPDDYKLGEGWENVERISQLQWELDLVAQELCIDIGRVGAVGHGGGGYGAERAPCVVEGVRAVATSSHRLGRGQQLCEVRTPHLMLAPLRDPVDPVEGGRSCILGVTMWPLQKHETVLKKRNNCTTTANHTHSHQDGTCTEWECETPLQICHIDGGRQWPGTSLPIRAESVCESPDHDFPHRQTIWEFLERHAFSAK